jgi:hypothetical protein
MWWEFLQRKSKSVPNYKQIDVCVLFNLKVLCLVPDTLYLLSQKFAYCC